MRDKASLNTIERLGESLAKNKIWQSARKNAKQQSLTPVAPMASAPQSVDIIPSGEDLKKRKEEQELDQQGQRFESEMEQWRLDRELKKSIATVVFRFLATETFCVFLIVLFQGYLRLGFHLDDTTINIFLGATLLQISSMAVIITRHLYPTSEKQ